MRKDAIDQREVCDNGRDRDEFYLQFSIRDCHTLACYHTHTQRG